MSTSIGEDAQLALDLALTIRHDGSGGVADDLATVAGLDAWTREHLGVAFGGVGGPSAAGPVVPGGALDVATGAGAGAGGGARAGAGGDGGAHGASDAELAAVREVRAALRALFARAVLPGAPSPADAARLMPARDAVERLNAYAALAPTVPVLTWADDADPVVRQVPVGEGSRPAATLARAAVAFLASPELRLLRACHAPRCVRYFLKDHPRQEWCKPSCGNRARVARHHERHRRPTQTQIHGVAAEGESGDQHEQHEEGRQREQG
ncbi:ABATE domain-containing protein [Streptomyces fructofermentans]|uniref:Zinc finger CGNR domain-containing protein n=1 Tax=Streptomyces fructofermentans TaxID=152141 RepID=A0A918NDC9_9ACTN|nr:CGNR zinc finger domain-containing protein [Streptomyces fructofermentans]GGX59135.1 hypothetical protein GCM10010515_28740 [Streptomyces fructofermentans]